MVAAILVGTGVLFLVLGMISGSWWLPIALAVLTAVDTIAFLSAESSEGRGVLLDAVAIATAAATAGVLLRRAAERRGFV